jgi:MFS family permease
MTANTADGRLARVMSLLAVRLESLRSVMRNPSLGKLQLTSGAFYLAEWAHIVALAVYAYEAGGAREVGIVGFIRMMPAAIMVPFAAVLVDRYPRQLVLLAVHGLRALTLGAAGAVIALGGAAAVVYAFAAAAALAATAFRPAQWALIPSLARTPRELVAANVSSSMLEGIATFGGPAVAGILLFFGGSSTVFVVSAGASAAAAILVVGISPGAVERGPSTVRREPFLREALGGVQTLADHPGPRLLISLFAAQTLVRGFLNVFIVVAAIELLDMGDSGVGFLNSSLGVGGLLGAILALGLVDRQRLGGSVALSLAFWGLPIAIVGILPEPALALVLLAVVGVANSLLDVSGLTLVQRSLPQAMLGRVFGVLETIAIASIGVGAILTPLLIELVGIRASLIVIGVFLPVLAVLSWRGVRAVDDAVELPEREISLLRSLPIFAPLSGATLELLASRLVPVRALPGTELIREGEPGDLFYVLVKGEAIVRRAGVTVAKLGPGDYFGEIALLRNVPRTATVTAASEVDLRTLERDIFVSAVSGDPQSAETAETAMSTRLVALRVPTTPL